MSGCISAPSSLTAHQQLHIDEIKLYEGDDIGGRHYSVIKKVSAANCSGVDFDFIRIHGVKHVALMDVRKKAAAMNADAVVNITCNRVPLLNNCWLATKCSGYAVTFDDSVTPMLEYDKGSQSDYRDLYLVGNESKYDNGDVYINEEKGGIAFTTTADIEVYALGERPSRDYNIIKAAAVSSCNDPIKEKKYSNLNIDKIIDATRNMRGEAVVDFICEDYFSVNCNNYNRCYGKIIRWTGK